MSLGAPAGLQRKREGDEKLPTGQFLGFDFIANTAGTSSGFKLSLASAS